MAGNGAQAGIPLEGLWREVGWAVAASMAGTNYGSMDVRIRPDGSGRPEFVDITIDFGRYAPEPGADQTEYRRMLFRDALGKNGLAVTKSRYGAVEHHECRLDPVWFTPKRPGAGIPLWEPRGEVGDLVGQPRVRMRGPTHHIRPIYIRAKFVTLGLGHVWGVYDNASKLLVTLMSPDPTLYDRAASVTTIGDRAPGRNSLVFERLSEAQAMLARITMEGEKITSRFGYMARDSRNGF